MKRPLISRRHDRCKPPKCPEKPESAAPEEKREKGQKEGAGITIVAAFREHLSDILGAFMPGMYFSIHLFVSAALLLFMLNNLSWENLTGFIKEDAPVLGLAMPFAAFLLCLFSYIIGSVFYRKDIKEPDTASAIRTYQMSSPEERKGLAFYFDALQGRPFNILTQIYMKINFRIDFPYSHLKGYLETRNYTHLADHIPWDGDKKEVKQRSKMFINILKARIHRYAPEEMPGIEKNEAHVRLMNSLWYAAKSIIFIAVVVLLTVIAFYHWHDLLYAHNFIFSGTREFHRDFAFCLAFFSGLQLLIALYIQQSIKQYFHYMRVREIVFLLEIADTVSQDIGQDLFEGLMEPDNKEPDTAMPPDTTKGDSK
ncbi:MAG: hypothetical protein LBR99_01165 [Treponema sp.]|jgi:hypothetical protein|nr:hypothetical protein [Treponema sp.]